MQSFGGSAIATFKLHLAAIHLPDQVRCSGASFFSLEFWVERLVQLYKHMVKYRCNAYPELLFINDQLLRLACQTLLRHRHGRHLVGMATAIQRIKEAGKRKRDTDVKDAFLLGKARPMTSAEEDAVLPHHDMIAGLKGIPYLLFSTPSLHESGWPAFPLFEEGLGRLWAILHELGLPSAGIPGDPGVKVFLHKFVRAVLPVGDTVSSLQCTTQRSKDNRWCLVQYTTHDNESLVFVGLIQYFVLAQYASPGPEDHLGGVRKPPKSLRLAVIHLLECESVHPPGSRAPDPELGRPQEMYRVSEEPRPGGRNGLPFRGEWVVPVDELQAQLVPTKKLAGEMYFMWSNKASSRAD